MGTNFYHHQNVCDHCGRGDEPRHIGKSSAGWCFSLHVYPEEGIHDLGEWIEHLTTKGGLIKDEYGSILSLKELSDVITKREGNPDRTRKPIMYESWEDFHQKNKSEDGPQGLVRSKIGPATRCIGHGKGTWDLMVGEFS